MPNKRVWRKDEDTFRVKLPEMVIGPKEDWVRLLVGSGFSVSDLARKILGLLDVIEESVPAGEMVIIPASMFPPKTVPTTDEGRRLAALHKCPI